MNTAVCAQCGKPMDPAFIADIRALRVALGLEDKSPVICAACVWSALQVMGEEDVDDAQDD